MQHPLTWFCGCKLDIISFSRCNTDCILRKLCRLLHRMTISGNDFERDSMEMHWMNELTDPDKTLTCPRMLCQFLC